MNRIYVNDLENIREYIISRTSRVRNTGVFQDIFVETEFHVPPTDIIKRYNLTYNKFISSWDNLQGEKVILVNNNQGHWYSDGVIGSIYIKESYFQKLKKRQDLKYFIFTERFIPTTGYYNDSALQMEMLVDGTEKHYKHYFSKRKTSEIVKKQCRICPFYIKDQKDLKKWQTSSVDIIQGDINEVL